MNVRIRFALAVALAGVLVALVVPAPFWLTRPGPVLDVGPLAGGEPGRIHALTVSAEEVTWAQAVWAMLTGAALMPVSGDGDQMRRRAEEQVRESAAQAQMAARAITGVDVTWQDDPRFGGPSAGLALGLALVDAAGPGDLTAGRRIAASATIDDTGEAGPVGSLGSKLLSARADGVDVVFVSPGSAPAAPVLTVVEVTSLQQAVQWLCEHGSNDFVCRETSHPGVD